MIARRNEPASRAAADARDDLFMHRASLARGL
jgi:hypothetical protein